MGDEVRQHFRGTDEASVLLKPSSKRYPHLGLRLCIKEHGKHLPVATVTLSPWEIRRLGIVLLDYARRCGEIKRHLDAYGGD